MDPSGDTVRLKSFLDLAFQAERNWWARMGNGLCARFFVTRMDCAIKYSHSVALHR